MIPDESVAYAIAAWDRFDSDVGNDLLKALSGAFAMVVAADGSITAEERDRFIGLLREKQAVFQPVDFGALERALRDLTDALIVDPDDGKRRALEHVGAVKDDPVHRELVFGAARIAAAADGRLLSVEEGAVAEIGRTLGY